LKLVIPAHGRVVYSLAFTPDGKGLASGGYSTNSKTTLADGEIKVWDVDTGELRKTFKGQPGIVECVAFSRDGKLLASAYQVGGNQPRVWDAGTGNRRHVLAGHARHTTVVVFSPDGKVLASAGTDKEGHGEVKLWDLTTGKERKLFRAVGRLRAEASGTRLCLAFSPDGKTLALGGIATPFVRVVKLWDVATGKERELLPSGFHAVHALAFSPDGKLLAMLQDGKVKVWELASGKQLWRTNDGGISRLAFAPDGKSVLVSVKGKVLWRDVATGKPVGQLRVKHNLICFALAKDGKHLATGGGDGKVRLWDVSGFPKRKGEK
jgi:Tol biopolymer transport system component